MSTVMQRRRGRFAGFKKTRTAKRRERGHTVFGDALAMLYRGEPIAVVLRHVFGRSDLGKLWVERFGVLLSLVPSHAHRRRIVRHFFRTFEGAKRHGSQWRVKDAAGYVGTRTELVTVHEFDPASGEVLRTKQKRRHVRKGKQGGLAKIERKCARTLDRYRRLLRAGGLMNSKQPPRRASDAVMPKRPDAQWAYGQHWLALPPPPAVIARWEAHEKSPPKRRPELARRELMAARSELGRPVVLEPADFPY